MTSVWKGIEMNYCGKSDIGLKRSENQDSFAIEKIFDGALLAVVCDGMGGVAGGKIASELAVKTFIESVSCSLRSYINSPLDLSSESVKIIEKILIEGAEKANYKVFSAAKENSELEGMGTTLTSALFIGERVYLINVGDSRIYQYSDSLVQLTRDHSFIQTLIEMGKISKEEAKDHPDKNVITRAIGIDDTVVPDTYTSTAHRGDLFLLCSDGLCGYVDERDIINIITDSRMDIIQKNTHLIDLANQSGGNDNVTTVLVTY